MRLRKAIQLLGMAFGSIAILVGLILIYGYFSEAVVARRGEPDQSLLFWYLPILFAGIVGVGGGATAVAMAVRGLRKGRVASR